jgi:hypothetical protein
LRIRSAFGSPSTAPTAVASAAASIARPSLEVILPIRRRPMSTRASRAFFLTVFATFSAYALTFLAS